jgi:hypothetical protein
LFLLKSRNKNKVLTDDGLGFSYSLLTFNALKGQYYEIFDSDFS